MKEIIYKYDKDGYLVEIQVGDVFQKFRKGQHPTLAYYSESPQHCKVRRLVHEKEMEHFIKKYLINNK